MHLQYYCTVLFLIIFQGGREGIDNKKGKWWGQLLYISIYFYILSSGFDLWTSSYYQYTPPLVFKITHNYTILYAHQKSNCKVYLLIKKQSTKNPFPCLRTYIYIVQLQNFIKLKNHKFRDTTFTSQRRTQQREFANQNNLSLDVTISPFGNNISWFSKGMFEVRVMNRH